MNRRKADLPIWLMALPVVIMFVFAMLMMLEAARAGEGVDLSRGLYRTAVEADARLNDLNGDTHIDVLPATLTTRTARDTSTLAPERAGLSHDTAPFVTEPVVSRTGTRPIVPQLAPEPSLKPILIARRPQQSLTADALKQILPVRPIPDITVQGSASELVNRLIAAKGVHLDRHQQIWLARDMERLLDEAADGHIAELGTASEARLQVVLEASREVQSEVLIAHAAAIETLPDSMVLEGGWYVARQAIPFSKGPGDMGHLTHGLERGMLIERMASYEGRPGESWYLMGHHGLALGFVASTDLVPAEEAVTEFEAPFSAPVAEVHRTLTTVQTTCRKGLIGARNAPVHAFDLCRNPLGNWMPFRESAP